MAWCDERGRGWHGVMKGGASGMVLQKGARVARCAKRVREWYDVMKGGASGAM